MLASRGFSVIGCDISKTAVDTINQGRAHFFEPDLDMILRAAVSTGSLVAQTSPTEADYFIVAVPTPVTPDKRPDLSHIEAATAALAPYIKKGSTIILESTSPVGTTEGIVRQLATLRPDLRMPRYRDAGSGDIFVAHCPERILPGQMLQELVSNDRIIGGMTPVCAERALQLYRSFVTGECILTDCRTAELVKLAENSFRDVNIAFANELSVICESLDMNVWEVIDLANKHPRVSILRPGAGVGGHCIAVDPWFIVSSAPSLSRLIRAAREVNDGKPHHVVRSILDHAAGLGAPSVACYGLTYKADVEDLRESPALDIVRELAESGRVNVLACDPHVERLPEELNGNGRVRLMDIKTATAEADIVAFLVGHKEFGAIDEDCLRSKKVVDAIGFLERER
jgi:UDP-N-acetyl-D-mannosaminuronic acid dehydrogenase